MATKEIETRKKYPICLDIADTIYITNYLLGYFAPSESASDLMRFQKIEDLKKKNIWDNYKPPFLEKAVLDKDNFGINVYFTGTPNDARRKQPDYIKLLDLTSSHINFGGWQSTDFVCTLAACHNTIKFIKEQTEVPKDEFILGFIRIDSGVLNNKPLQEFLGQNRLMPEFINQHILNAKILVPTPQFGKIRGGKLLALLSQSNEIRDFFNEKYKRNIVLWYSMSLYGSTKNLCQYDQLDAFVKFIGKTDSTHIMRMKNPHKDRILGWLDRRGISKSNFSFHGSSKSDRNFRELISFVEHCLWLNASKDKTVKELKAKFEQKLENLVDIQEQKRCYVSTYGMENWDDNLINYEREIKPENNLENLFNYWKTKVFIKRDWGMRKYKDILNNPINLEQELLNE